MAMGDNEATLARHKPERLQVTRLEIEAAGRATE